ncbi:hypothetical protein [Melittangium boletus]|uniref:hypothetical protein n=1 Tax=Melittangium boletus TaxID=83453 RepID=UPI003DA4AD97
MKPRLLTCAFLFLPACSVVGIYKHAQAEWASPQESASVQFPSSMEGSTTLTGPAMAALKVAMDDYRPPGIDRDSLKTPEDQCLSRWENIDMRVLQAQDDLFFVQFSPDPRKCKLDVVMPDIGAVYAVDGAGRILARE